MMKHGWSAFQNRADVSRWGGRNRVTFAVVLLLVLSGCGGDSIGDSTTTSIASTTTTNATAQPTEASTTTTTVVEVCEPEKTSLTVATPGSTSPANVPQNVALNAGFFEDEGLTVEEVRMSGSGVEAITSVIGGSADYAATVSYEHVLRAAAQGRPATVIATLTLVPGYAVVVNQDHLDAETIADVADLTIGVASLGGGTDAFLRYIMVKHGVEVNDGEFIAVGTGAAAITAMESGDIQVLSSNEPAITELVTRRNAKVIHDARTVEGAIEIFGAPYPSIVVFVPNTFAAENPCTTRALARAYSRALDYIQTHNVQEITDFIPADVFFPDGDRERWESQLELALPAYNPTGAMPLEGAQTVLDSLILTSGPEVDLSGVIVEDTFDNSFIEAGTAG